MTPDPTVPTARPSGSGLADRLRALNASQPHDKPWRVGLLAYVHFLDIVEALETMPAPLPDDPTDGAAQMGIAALRALEDALPPRQAQQEGGE